MDDYQFVIKKNSAENRQMASGNWNFGLRERERETRIL
jgi:hypothetical protein